MSIKDCFIMRPVHRGRVKHCIPSDRPCTYQIRACNSKIEGHVEIKRLKVKVTRYHRVSGFILLSASVIWPSFMKLSR